MLQDLQDLFDESGYEGWEVVDDCVLACPHGHNIEWDGFVSYDCGCRSPLLILGIF